MAYLDDHRADVVQQSFRLVEIVIGGTAPLTVRMTECDVDIEWDGHTWTAGPIVFDEIRSQPDGQRASFTIADADHVLFAALNGSNGAEAAPVSIWQAYFAAGSKSAAPDQVEQIFSGAVDSAMKDTAGGTDQVEFQCGPGAATAAVNIPWRLLSELVRHV